MRGLAWACCGMRGWRQNMEAWAWLGLRTSCCRPRLLRKLLARGGLCAQLVFQDASLMLPRGYMTGEWRGAQGPPLEGLVVHLGFRGDGLPEARVCTLRRLRRPWGRAGGTIRRATRTGAGCEGVEPNGACRASEGSELRWTAPDWLFCVGRGDGCQKCSRRSQGTWRHAFGRPGGLVETWFRLALKL